MEQQKSKLQADGSSAGNPPRTTRVGNGYGDDFPWNLPAEHLPELPINRELLEVRYKEILPELSALSALHPGESNMRAAIRSAVRGDVSKLSMAERAYLYQHLLRLFGVSRN